MNFPLPSSDWLVGSVNLDEDLHYSSYFLRAATGAFGDHATRYGRLISVYHGTKEIYFVEDHEARKRAFALIEQLREGDVASEMIASLADKVSEFERYARKTSLSHRRGFTKLPTAMRFYEAHDRKLRKLYSVARIPEVLDRGRPWFTDHLKSLLADRLEQDVTSDDVSRAFVSLTLGDPGKPARTGVLSGAGYVHLIRQLSTSELSETDLETMSENPGLAHQLLSPDVLSRLKLEFDNKRFLSYHGYVRRSPPAFDDFLARFVRDVNVARSRPSSQLGEGNVAPHKFSRALDMDKELVSLFRFYRTIGYLKLRRRIAQLRLFPILDDFLRLAAEVTATREWDLRRMMPEELVEYVTSRGQSHPGIGNRSNECLALWSADGVCISTSPSLTEDWLGFSNDAAPVLAGDLTGEPVYPGVRRGRCIVLDRSMFDRSEALLSDDYVLVSEATDLDMLDLMISAQAVVTSRGGITSHAATICRELAITSVVGVRNASQILRTGMFIEVDGSRGVVKVLT
ncbi:PEP-utilizing enzyme [Micromonospora sp. NPDC005553]|uniref:PEP-utilizing enzyme n=1 Tax=Micromonospora sp. NPDC005553 TaxID=3364232 RepID=UPI0036A848E5